MSLKEWPAATNPTTVPTVTRIPRTQGLPPMTLGFRVIRSRCAIESDSIVDRKRSRRFGRVSGAAAGVLRGGGGAGGSGLSGASERKAQGRANLLHPVCAQVGDAAAQSRLGHGYRIVQIDRATALHSVIDIQHHFGRHAANGRGDGRDGYGRQMANRAVARQTQTRPLLVRGREAAKADLAPAQSSGHAAASSQMRDSSSRCGWAKYPRRSCSSNASSCKRLRCCCNAWRINADRFTFCRLAARSAACRSLVSSTTCIISIVDSLPQCSPHCQAWWSGIMKVTSPMAKDGYPRIFVSYARKDGAELALRLQKDLTAAGYDVWLDTKRIRGGESWTVEIEAAIDRADVVLALLTPGSYVSAICRCEQLRSLRKGKCVIPLLAEA